MSVKKLARLVDLHLGELKESESNWKVDWSPVAGRGVFAVRDIEQGELLFREQAVVLGPTARKGSPLNTCVVCCKLLDVTNFLCPKGCTLPVCGNCSDSQEHKSECELFREWEPIDVGGVSPMTLRILTAVRSLFVSKDKKDLICAMQANTDRGYRMEITRASEGFKNFPSDKKVLDFLLKVVGVLNTNAFETPKKVDGYEILLRGLFPLTAVMNHECTPNASHYFENGSLAIIRAAKFIPKGCEITTTYTKILWSNLMRRMFLKMTKHFICECPRCKDPTENNTFLAALYCREPNCRGLAIPVHTSSLQPDWKCHKCQVISNHAKMGKYQDFTLTTIHNKINSCSVRDMIYFINEVCPKFCPPSNYVLIEAKLNVIWRIQRSNEEYTEDDYQARDQYCKDVVEILDKLEAGDCTLRKLIKNEINHIPDFSQQIDMKYYYEPDY